MANTPKDQPTGLPTPSNTTEREKLFLIIEPALFNYPDRHYIDIALEQLVQHTAQAVRVGVIKELKKWKFCCDSDVADRLAELQAEGEKS